jgi:hypothetical protein
LPGCFSLEDNGKERRLSFATDDIEYAKRYQEAGLRVLCCVMEESRQGLVPVHGFTAARNIHSNTNFEIMDLVSVEH